MLDRKRHSRVGWGLLAAGIAATAVLAASDGKPVPKPRRTPTAAPAPKASRPAAPAAANSCAVCLEKGAILDPAQLPNGSEPDVRLSYEAARRYPDTIDRLHCFCECKESQREHHKSLLTCFTSPHAAGCGICQREALLAARLKDQGMSDDQVETTVESVSRTDGHTPTFGRGM